ncbi:MAG: 2OG-Fe dioxygenase family protein [Pseudomonadota bacterium]
MSIRLLYPPNLSDDKFAIKHFECISNETFQARHREVFGSLVPGKNAVNQLSRGIRWGTLTRDQFTWLDRSTYKLSAALNPEERGAERQFVLIPETYLRTPEVESVLRAAFGEWRFPESSYERAYEVQLSAIRYEPSLQRPALPSPLIPHQDQVDGAIVVMAKTEHVTGGTSRLYTLDEQPRYETDLEIGDALFVRDASWKHQVTPVLLTPGSTWHAAQRVFRDVLLIRFAPLGR